MAVIKDSVSNVLIGGREDASDSNAWENEDHNDRLSSEMTELAPSQIGRDKEMFQEAELPLLVTPAHFWDQKRN